MKNGKVDIKKKSATASAMKLFYGSTLDLPEPIAEYLESIGHGHKFINTTLMKRRGGQSKMGWVPVRLPAEVLAKLPQNPFAPTETKDFYVVGDLVLASKTKAEIKEHRDFLDEKVRVQREGHTSQVDAKGRKLISENGEY